MGGEEHYAQAANEDTESDSLAADYVSHCHSQDPSPRFWLALSRICVSFYIKPDWV